MVSRVEPSPKCTQSGSTGLTMSRFLNAIRWQNTPEVEEVFMNILEKLSHGNLPKNKIPAFKAGDVVKVHCKIVEGEKERIQIFEGVVIKRHNNGLSSSFVVRKV